MRNEQTSIKLLDPIYCLDNGKVENLPLKKIEKKSNLLALIVTCITKYYPEMGNLSEGKFIRFQEELSNLLNKNIKCEDMVWIKKLTIQH